MLDKDYKYCLKNHIIAVGTKKTLENLEKRFRDCVAGKCKCNICHIGDRALAIKILKRFYKMREKRNCFI